MNLALVGDVGGTHARFGWVDLSDANAEPNERVTYECGDYGSVEDALSTYLRRLGEHHAPEAVAIAVAGPVVDGRMSFTNRSWTISEQGLSEAGFGRAVVMNDYGALALAARRLSDRDSRRIGPEGAFRPDRPVAVLGPGTGFGVAALVPHPHGEATIETEGGHVSFAPVDALEVEVLRVLARRYGRVSIERILSGPGLLNLHQALGEIRGEAVVCAGPAEITQRAMTGDPLAQETVQRFCAILGSTAGDFALSYGALGGVCIAGGIAPRLLHVLESGEFRARFEAKGRFRDYLAAIPTRVATDPYLALSGAAYRLQVGRRNGQG